MNRKRFYDGLDDDLKEGLLAQVRDLWTHASTAIEGNSLTLGETAFVLAEGLTVAGKPLKDHEEVYGHAKAIELVYRLLTASTASTAITAITAAELFALHKALLTERIVDIYQPVGAWKTETNSVYIVENNRPGWRQYPSAAHTPHLMAQWLERFNAALAQEMSQAAAAMAYADLHLTFVTIHPFCDGNGRMARLLSNLPVLASGYPPIIVPLTDRQQYIEAISQYQSSITHLAEASDIAELIDEAKMARFALLCTSYWSETMSLVEGAKAIQQRRDAEREDFDSEREDR